MVDENPKLKEEIGGSIPGCEISFLLVNLLCFGVGMSAFCLKKTKDKVFQCMKACLIWILHAFVITFQRFSLVDDP